MTSKDFYNVKIINDIIYNENTHIVSVFKDYLILDDISEFLKRRYASFETKPRLTKIYEFYDKYSKVFPNYVALPESKYMFKNIERKQRMIDEKQKFKSEKERKQKEREEKKMNFGGFSDLLDSSESIDRLFDTNFIDSVNKISPHSVHEGSYHTNQSRFSQLEEHRMQSSMISQHSQIYKESHHSNWERMLEICNQSGFRKPAHEMALEELVEEFIENDSEILTNMSMEHSINMESSTKNISEKKRKVKRVDYTLKLTSNDIERNNPPKDVNKKHPITYRIASNNEILTVEEPVKSNEQFNKCFKKKPMSQKKRLNDKEIFGTTDRQVLNTQRYDKVSYNSSKYSPGKTLKQSKSTHSIKEEQKTGQPLNKNFKVISQKGSMHGTLNSNQIANLKSDRIHTNSYKTINREERVKGHQRIETWNGNTLLNRKGSNVISQNRQSMQGDTSTKVSKGYKAYLTNKRASNHSRKKTSIVSGTTDSEVAKTMAGSKNFEINSASKLSRVSQRPESAFENRVKGSRQSLNALAPETKYLTKPLDKAKNGEMNKLETPTNFSKEGAFKTTGILTARTTMKQPVEIEAQRSERKFVKNDSNYKLKPSQTRHKRVMSKKVRSKGKIDGILTKESSSNSSNCPSSLSKSTSRKKEGITNTKHQKKKSAAIPTRTTKALYSNKAEYEKKRESKVVLNTLKPSFSTSKIDTRIATTIMPAKVDTNIKYPTYDKLPAESSYQRKRDTYNIIKSSRETRRLIEFKLHDDEESTENFNHLETLRLEDSKSTSKDLSKQYSQGKLVDTGSTTLRRLHSNKSEQKLEAIRNKYGKPLSRQSDKPKHPSISIEKPSLQHNKGTKYELISKPR